MRTDAPIYNDTFKKCLELFVKKQYGNEYYNEIPSTPKKAHEGIRVTDLNVRETSFETKQINKLYNLIWIHTLQTSMSDCVIETTQYKLNAPMELYFTYKEPKTIFDGWQIVSKKIKTETYNLYLSLLSNISLYNITCKEILKSPVYHYCESQIIQKLEKLEIGRPSTYASILSKLYDKNYIVKGKIHGTPIEITNYILSDNTITHTTETTVSEEVNKISITETGKKVIEFCYKYYNHLFEYEYTKDMEHKLDIIEQTGKWKDIFIDFKREVDKEVLIDQIKPPQKSLHCGLYNKSPVVIKQGQFGYYMEYKKNTTSLVNWSHYNDIEQYIEEQEFPPDLLESIMTINIVINKDISIRNGKYGDYIYHKTDKMKKPKFYKLDIESRTVADITEYIKKKYNHII